MKTLVSNPSFEEVKGNLLDMFDEGKFHAIIHGANCKMLMGAGIAGQIARRYPEAKGADDYFVLDDIERLGCFSFARLRPSGRYIINLYSQYLPGPDANLAAIEVGMKKIAVSFSGKISKIGVPLIGCRIGGLDWQDVEPIIKKELKNFNLTVVHYEAK